MLTLVLTALLSTQSYGLPSEPNTRTIEFSAIPEDVAVGEIAFGQSRFLYTYVNSSNILTALAVGVVGIFGIAIFLYLYDLYVVGGSSGYIRNGSVNEADFDYYDPYGYNNSFDPTTRIKKRYVTYVPSNCALFHAFTIKLNSTLRNNDFTFLWLLCMNCLPEEVCLLLSGADLNKLFFRTC